MNTTFARSSWSFKMSSKGDHYRKKTTHKKVASSDVTKVTTPPPSPMSQPTTPVQASSDGVQVLLHNLPNTLCNHMCMEAMLEQAWLDESVLNIEVQPGAPCGNAKLYFSAWAAANQCVRHFQGCRWDQTGASVYAEILNPPSGLWMPDSGANNTTAPNNNTCTGGTESSLTALQQQAAAITTTPKSTPKPTPKLASISSPTRSPMGSPLSCGSESTKLGKTSSISWADLCSSDEESTAEETQEQTTEDGVVTDDGF